METYDQGVMYGAAAQIIYIYNIHRRQRGDGELAKYRNFTAPRPDVTRSKEKKENNDT